MKNALRMTKSNNLPPPPPCRVVNFVLSLAQDAEREVLLVESAYTSSHQNAVRLALSDRRIGNIFILIGKSGNFVLFTMWTNGIPIFYVQRKELTTVGCSFPAFFSGGKHEKQSRCNGNAQRDAGIGVCVHQMRDAGNEAQMLRSRFNLKGAPDSCRWETSYKNELSEITLSLGMAAKSAVTRSGRINVCNPIRRNFI